jgi:methyltransferase (TIGR00027 family)
MRAGHPSVTARWAASQRLRLERTRPSTPEGDVGAEHRLYCAIAGGVTVPVGGSSVMALRTHVVDAEVARAIGRATTQIVLLGAGYDGRALRFGGGAVRWFEVDRPATLEHKRQRLAELGIVAEGVTTVGLDLLHASAGEVDTALGAVGHDADAASLFVCDGLLDALTLEATASLCTALRGRAAPGSVLVATCSVAPEGGAPVRVLRTASGVLRQATDEPRRNEFRPGDPQKLMVVTGWRVTHAESSPQRRLDPGAHTLILVCEPDPARA